MRLVLRVALFMSAFACGKSHPAGDAPPSVVTAPALGGTVQVVADEKGFTPSEVHATKGVPLSLVFTRTSDNTCAKDVVFPELKINRPLPLNQPVTVALPSDATRSYRFQCGMAMYQGSVVIR